MTHDDFKPLNSQIVTDHRWFDFMVFCPGCIQPGQKTQEIKGFLKLLIINGFSEKVINYRRCHIMTTMVAN